MNFLDFYVPDNVNKINPIEYLKRNFIEFEVGKFKEKLFAENPILTLGVNHEFFYKKAEDNWNIYFEKILNLKIPQNFITLLKNKDLSKSQQKNILKNQSLSLFEMEALKIKAWIEYNYSYSYYHFDVLNLKNENYKLPNVFYYNENKLLKIGETNLTDAELKQIINQRNSRVIHFFDNGIHWHCFFITYRSISGKETWNSEKPHYHYISDKWNIKREDAIEQFEKGNYPSTNVHITINI